MQRMENPAAICTTHEPSSSDSSFLTLGPHSVTPKSGSKQDLFSGLISPKPIRPLVVAQPFIRASPNSNSNTVRGSFKNATEGFEFAARVCSSFTPFKAGAGEPADCSHSGSSHEMSLSGIKRTVPETDKDGTAFGTEKPVKCNCKRSGCLKKYCECYKAGKACQGCNCTGCENVASRPQQAVARTTYFSGCNCKKSGCRKKYCECFQRGIKCGESCKCEQCQNHAPSKVHAFRKLYAEGEENEGRTQVCLLGKH